MGRGEGCNCVLNTTWLSYVVSFRFPSPVKTDSVIIPLYRGKTEVKQFKTCTLNHYDILLPHWHSENLHCFPYLSLPSHTHSPGAVWLCIPSVGPWCPWLCK